MSTIPIPHSARVALSRSTTKDNNLPRKLPCKPLRPGSATCAQKHSFDRITASLLRHLLSTSRPHQSLILLISESCTKGSTITTMRPQYISATRTQAVRSRTTLSAAQRRNPRCTCSSWCNSWTQAMLAPRTLQLRIYKTHHTPTSPAARRRISVGAPPVLQWDPPLCAFAPKVPFPWCAHQKTTRSRYPCGKRTFSQLEWHPHILHPLILWMKVMVPSKLKALQFQH
jgi:hypothetical protein